MPIKTLKPNALIATCPRTGSQRASLFRGKNVWIRGSEPEYYGECYQGSLNLNETIPTAPLTGLLSLTAGDKLVLGGGTLFMSELHPGQFLLAGGQILVVDRVLSDVQFLAHRAPTATVFLPVAYRLPVLFDLDKRRGTLLRGNAVEFEQGSVIAVGDGDLRANGALLPGTSLAASRLPKIAVLNPATGNYSVYQLGMPIANGVTASNIAGGTRGMTAGARGIRVCRGRLATGKGYGNPGENLLVTLGASEKIRLHNLLTSMDAASGQDCWIIFTTIYESATSFNQAEGPWFKLRVITAADIAGDGTFDFEYLNSEVNRGEILSFNNDAPTDAEFVTALTGYPIYVSCQGKGTPARPNGTSPGPFIVPAKPNNIEAAPLAFPNPVATSPPETILGCVGATGRLFLLTANRLNFAAFSGNPNFPITIRPFWRTGFANPYNLAFVNGMLYAATTGGFTRSIADGDEGGEEHSFASDIAELVRNANLGHMLTAHDPKNEAVCFFESGAYKNAAGFWVTVVYPYLLRQRFWNPPIVIESETRDMIVSGVATINGNLEFVAGGTTSNNTIEMNTYRFDAGEGEPVNWYLAWSYSDEGLEQNAKTIKGFRVTGKTTNATLGIFGTRSGESINVSALETGNSASASGAIPINTKTEVTLNNFIKLVIRELLLFTARVEGVWSGSGEKDRIDEIALLVEAGGLRK